MTMAAVLDRLEQSDPAGCATTVALGALVDDATRVRAWLDAFDARCVARADGVDCPDHRGSSE